MLPAGILDKLTADRGIAGEVPAKSAGYRAWVQVIVFAIDQETGMARSPSMIDSLLYRVMCFDLPSHLDFHNYEVDDYCEFRFNVVVQSLEAVEELLRKCVPDLEQLGNGQLREFPV